MTLEQLVAKIKAKREKVLDRAQFVAGEKSLCKEFKQLADDGLSKLSRQEEVLKKKLYKLEDIEDEIYDLETEEHLKYNSKLESILDFLRINSSPHKGILK